MEGVSENAFKFLKWAGSASESSRSRRASEDAGSPRRGRGKRKGGGEESNVQSYIRRKHSLDAVKA